MKNILTLIVMTLVATSSLGMSSLNGRKKTVTKPAKVEVVKPTETVVVPGGTATTDTTVKTPDETIKVEVVPGQVSSKSDYAVKSTLSFMKDVGEVANCVIYNADFIKEVSTHKQFDYTKDSSKLVAEKMSRFTPVILTTYKKSSTATLAYRNVGSNVLHFNTGKNKSGNYLNPRAMKYMLNTAIHERLHVVGYGHGDNKAAGKSNSVPYGIGKIAEKYAERCNKTKTK